MTLEKYIKNNMIHETTHPYYNEYFILIVFDYTSSYELTLQDIKFLNENKYSMYDILDEEHDEELLTYLESEIKKQNLNLY